jgi:methylglutaconyl-CoA hydratase
MLRAESSGPILRLTLDRPEVRNAFNDELIDRLSTAFRELPDGTRAVILASEGPGFCAGGDLEWMRKAAAYSEDENVRDALRLARLFKSIAECPAVVIARIQGAAYGGGCGLVAAADVAVASADAKFAFSEVKLGLIPATISPFVIAKIGQGHARALFTTGEAFGADRALRIGLVHEVVDSVVDLDEAVDRKVSAVLSSGPEAIKSVKSLMGHGDLSLDECARRLARARASTEGREGVAAFLEKRKASFVVNR